MGDETDRSQRINEDFQAFALDLQLKLRDPADYTATGADCAECGEEIPAGRRKAMPGCRFCTNCQADHDNEQLLSHWRAL